MEQSKASEIKVESGLVAGGGVKAGMVRKSHYTIECVRNGKVIWTEEIDNLVMTGGLNDSLDKHFKGASYTAAWYVGICQHSSSPSDTLPVFAVGDTLASHAGWTEVTAYTGDRDGLSLGTVAAGSVDNSGDKASYTLTGSAYVGGAFVTTAASGTSGVLYGGGQFSQVRSLITSDVLNVTVTLTAANPA